MRSRGYRLIIFKAIIFYNQIFFKIPNDKRKSARLLPAINSNSFFRNLDKKSYYGHGEPRGEPVNLLSYQDPYKFWGSLRETHRGTQRTR